MRKRLREAKPGEGPWDVKNTDGGLTDVAFLCQYLTLISAAQLGRPPRAVGQALDWFAKNGELAQEDAVALKAAHSAFEAVLQVGRAATGGANGASNRCGQIRSWSSIRAACPRVSMSSQHRWPSTILAPLQAGL